MTHSRPGLAARLVATALCSTALAIAVAAGAAQPVPVDRTAESDAAVPAPAGTEVPAGAAQAGADADAGARVEQRCASWTATRRPLFGDLHVHTTLSFDANSLGVRNRPADAYRFARGDEIGLQPYAADGTPQRTARLERPLDFAAVTDHSELLGELHICRTPGAEGHDSLLCRIQRRWPLLAYILVSSRMLSTDHPLRYTFCGEDGRVCREAAAGPWQVIRDAAEGAYDRTDACTFTSLVGYEWSGGPGGNMTHRNVIFADERAPDLPVSYIDEQKPEGLWRALESACTNTGCRFLTIPHNSNLSNGLLFRSETGTPEEARRWREMEPLIEIIQHKGDSECRAGQADEYCSFEKLPFSRMEEQPFPTNWREPEVGLAFAREILGDGLVREAKVGVNPFRLGMIGSTDTHLAAAGLTDERGYPGHGAGGDTSAVEIPVVPDSVHFNPGGLAVVWAEQNSRESIWQAMRRREVYATSGPRIVVRFFGGFGYDDAICSSERLVEDGYAGGVPMGGELEAAGAAGRAPVFVVSALQDAGTASSPGTPLERLQIVKVWLEDGRVREKVFDVAVTDAPVSAGDLDPTTCRVPTKGSAALCGRWSDEDWAPATSALYYARVIERPTCRWTGHLCAQAKVDCADPSRVPAELAFCCQSDVAKVVNERAVTSPIWIPAARRD